MYATAKVESKFTGLMNTAHDTAQTGKIYAYYRDNNVIHVGTLFFKKGEICGCNYDKLSGVDAVNSLAGSVISTAMFVPAKPAELIDQPMIPDFDQVLAALNRGEVVGGAEHLTLDDLVPAVGETLADVLGSMIKTKVDMLSLRVCPQKNLPAFKSESVKLATQFVGAKKAKELLDPLFELIA